jgi:hypothetical protein
MLRLRNRLLATADPAAAASAITVSIVMAASATGPVRRNYHTASGLGGLGCKTAGR